LERYHHTQAGYLTLATLGAVLLLIILRMYSRHKRLVSRLYLNQDEGKNDTMDRLTEALIIFKIRFAPWTLKVN